MALDETYHRDLLASGDDSDAKYPEAHNKDIYKYEMLGQVPFTAHMDSLPKEQCPDIYLNFTEEPYVRSRGDLTDCYTDSTLTTAYASGGVEGTELFFKTTEAEIGRIIKGNTLIIWNRVTGQFIDGMVFVEPVISGANSYLGVRLSQDDTDAVCAGATLSYTLNGQAQEEGDTLPQSLMTDLLDWQNQTQIFAAAFSLTGSQEARLQYFAENEDSRQMRSMNTRILQQMEMAYMFSNGQRGRGPTGKPLRRVMGVIQQMRTRIAAGTLDDRFYRYAYDPDYAGKDFSVGGWDWFKKIMSETSTLNTGIMEKDIYLGSGLWQHLADLLESRTHYQWDTVKSEFGYNIKCINGLQKSVRIWNHPLFSEDPALRYSGFMTERGLCKLRPYRPMKVIRGKYEDQDGNIFEDQKKAGILYEGTMEWHGLENMAFITSADTSLV